MKRIVYTVGHSNRTINEFLKLLRKYDIRVIVDVRRFPTSSKYPYFSLKNLKGILESQDIKYIWLGSELGGYRDGGYLKYMESNIFKKGLKRLIQIIESHKENVAIMCSEKFWFKCHRRFIANELARKGYRIIHIVDYEKTSIHKLREYTKDR